MKEQTDPLLDAIEALTKPIRVKVPQIDDAGQHIKTWTITHDSLLDQFRAAVIPSTNTAAGSSALASTRNMLDSTALYEYSKIASATGDWCRLVGRTATRDAKENLTHWYPAFQAEYPEPDVTKWYLTELRQWANLIREHLDPPRRRSITYPCPVCGKTSWIGADGDGGTWPLELQYRVDDSNEPVIERVICRACEPHTIWPTRDAARELLEELTERHAG
ncbi:DUF7341 domain-containing protein [Leifsonia poae]|uniref:DUF7341 domain-containing protein n=1 Tax=Leifsonia poae TaxID=110933 RepID=UPI001CBB0A7E|nr:hypothetical protein [Leifsonia poae]